MSRLAKLLLVFTTLILLSFATSSINATTLVVGSNDNVTRYAFGLDPGNASSAFPDFTAGGTYQQVYANNAFAGPVTITQIAFASSAQVTSGPGTATYNFSISLSTTPAGPGGLSTDLAANRGPDFVQVFSGPITATLSASDQFDLIVDIVPFTYNRAAGNLLIEVSTNAATQFTGGPILYYRAGFDPNTSRAANPAGLAGGTFTDGFGLQTRFTTLAPTSASASISGRVTDENGIALPSVTMSLTGAKVMTAITDADGIYRFGDAQVGDFYTVTPALASHHFSPEGRSFPLVGNTTDANFTALTETVGPGNPIDSNEFFVRQQYQDFLDREPEPQGFNFWVSQLNQCREQADCLQQRRIEVSAAFFQSVEFQETGSYICRLYEGALGRPVRYREFAIDFRRVIGSTDLAADKLLFANDFVARHEFLQKYQANTTAESFVDALLQTLREATRIDLSRQRARLIERYNMGDSLTERRGRVVAAIGDNPIVGAAVYNRTFVRMEYFGYLRREIDTQGFDFWLNVLDERDNGNYRGMVCSFITSIEYQQRFGTFVSHSNADCGQ